MHISSKVLLLSCIVLICLSGILGQRRKNPKKRKEGLDLLPKWPECGQVISDRVIGGERTRIHEFPWTVLLKMSGVESICGGSLINNRYVLTAAHCIKDIKHLEDITVTLGEWDITNSGEDIESEDIRGEEYNFRAPAALSIPVERRKIHREYVNGSHSNDIALLRLAEPVNYTRFIRPICLPSHPSFVHMNFTGYAMDVAGWGMYKNNITTPSPIKLKATLRVLDCSEYAGEIEICAIGENGVDSCHGDSGGPLMVETTINHDPMYIIAGVVSYGPEVCGKVNKTSLYTKVDAYIDWILNNIHP